ncbi:MAG: FtsX-like permease family protein, partial [Candidatus Riflebacteria bacterium]
INNATERENGHVCLAAPGYVENPNIADHIDENAAKELPESCRPLVKGVCPRISVFALLSCGDGEKNKTQPSQIIGIDPTSELGRSRLADDMITGNFLSGEDRQIILGKSLAQRIKATVGSEIILLGTAADGSIASEILVVCGIFSSGDNLRDSAMAFINLKQAQEIFVLENRVHSLRLFLRDPMQAETIARSLGKTGLIEATAWHRMFPQVADLLKLWLRIQIFTTFLYYAALALITFNTMYMAFIERQKEFAILKAIGMNRLGLAGLITAESLMISGMSALIGAIIGMAANFYLYYRPLDLSRWMQAISWGGSTMKPVLFCVPTWISFLMPITAMLALGFLVSLLPNFRLYRLKPVEALREG